MIDKKPIAFTPEQNNAIKHATSPGVIIAGAGSGKTTVMGARVMHLVKNENIPADGILGLTFTNLATGELRSQIRENLRELEAQKSLSNGELDDFAEPTITTYHSFSSKLVKEFGILLGIEPDHDIISDVRRNQICSKTISNSNLDLVSLGATFGTILERVLKLDDSLSDTAVSTEALIEFDTELLTKAATHSPDSPNSKFEINARKRIILAQLVDEFRLMKLSYNVLDYADMTRIALELVKFEKVQEQFQNQYKMVLLDEYQDTSIAQRKLLQTLFPSGHPVNAVGDPLQSIYAFRGASSRNISEFTTHFPLADGSDSPRFSLPLTQRNGKNIVRAANALTDRLRQADAHPELSELVARDDLHPGIIHIASFETKEEEANWILSEIDKAKALGIAPEQIALLFRERDGIDWALKFLNEANVAAQVRTKTDLLVVPEIVEIISMLRVIAQPAANSAWIRLLTGSRWQIGDRDLAIIGRVAANLAHNQRVVGKRDLESTLQAAVAGSDLVENTAYGDAILEIATNGNPQLSPEAVLRIKNLNAEIEFLRYHAGEPLKNFVYRVASVSGLLIETVAENERIKRGMDSNLRTFFSLVADFNSLIGETNLFAFLKWIEDSAKFKKKVEISGIAHKGAVQLITVHSSKGLQFDAVIMPTLAEGIFPSSEGAENWVTNSFVVPLPLRDEKMHSTLASYPDANVKWDTKYEKEYDALRKLNDSLEERRLAYVGITRTRKFLALSTSAVDPTVKDLRAPSIFFKELLEVCLNIVDNGDDENIAIGPIHEFFAGKNKYINDKVTGSWPIEINSDAFVRIKTSAATVKRLMSGTFIPERLPGTIADEWDIAIKAIEAEMSIVESPQKLVQLPESLSVTQIQHLARDEASFVANLIRPMPVEPVAAAAQGTAFHAFIENWAGGRLVSTLPSMDSLDVTEQERIDTPTLSKYKETFKNSKWAKEFPFVVEAPFAISLGGYIVRGRIDAVYKDGDNYTLVDWKTNAKANADTLQLAIYRLAWADSMNVPLENISASFYYVALDETVTPETFPSREEIIKLLSGS